MSPILLEVPPIQEQAHAQLDEKALLDAVPPNPQETLSRFQEEYRKCDTRKAWSETAAAIEQDAINREKRWNDELDSFLVYSSITSAVITTFAVQTYPLLRPLSDGAETVLLQAILATQLQNIVLDSEIPGRSILATAGTQARTPSLVVIALNTLIFSSLVCSVGATMFGIFTKEWIHESHSPQAPLRLAKDSARRNLYLFQSMKSWGIESILRWLFLLLQSSTILFFAALLALLWEYHPFVAGVASVLVGCVLILAFASIILPTIYDTCCYFTPLTLPLYRLMQRVKYIYQKIQSAVYRLIRNRRLALIDRKQDQEGGDMSKLQARAEIMRRYPTTIDAIVSWDERQQLSMAGASADVNCRLIEMYVNVNPEDASMILLLCGDKELEPRSFQLLLLPPPYTDSTVDHTSIFYLSPTVPVDFWIASLFKIMPLMEQNAQHSLQGQEVASTIWHILIQIKMAYLRLQTPTQRSRLLQALSLVAHYSIPKTRLRTLAHDLLAKHLSSDEVIQDCPWPLARDGIAVLYRRLAAVLAVYGFEHDEAGWKEATSLVPVLVRCCLLSNQRWEREAERNDLESLRNSGYHILRRFADVFLIPDIAERVEAYVEVLRDRLQADPPMLRELVEANWVPQRRQEKLASFIQLVGVCVTSILEVLTEKRVEELSKDVAYPPQDTMPEIELWLERAEKTSRELTSTTNPTDVLQKVKQRYDTFNMQASRKN